MSKKSVTIEGVQYNSRTEAAKALVAAGKTLAEAAAATGMTYQTVYANTKGADKVSKRRTKYRVLAMGRSGMRTSGEIAKKTGLSVSAVVAMLKKNGIAILTKKEAKSAAKSTANSTKTPKAKTSKAKKAVTETTSVEEPVVDEIPEDAVAAAQAMADMAESQ